MNSDLQTIADAIHSHPDVKSVLSTFIRFVLRTRIEMLNEGELDEKVKTEAIGCYTELMELYTVIDEIPPPKGVREPERILNVLERIDSPELTAKSAEFLKALLKKRS